MTSYFVDSVLVAAAGERASRDSYRVVGMRPSAVLAVGHSGVDPPSARVVAASVMLWVQFVSATAVVDLASDLELEATVAVVFAVFAAEFEDDPAFEPSLFAAAVLVSVSAAAVGPVQLVSAVVTSHQNQQQE